jgi:hypothetical protein
MENYIIRIYRRDDQDPAKVTGILESVEQQSQQAFSSLTALQGLLERPANNKTSSQRVSSGSSKLAVAD